MEFLLIILFLGFAVLVIIGTTESKFRNVVLLFVAAPFFIVAMEDEVILVLFPIAVPLIVMRLLGLQLKVQKAEDSQFIKFPVYEKSGSDVIGSNVTGSGIPGEVQENPSRKRDLFDT